MLHHEQIISCGEMHTLIMHLWLALWLLIQWMVYKLIYIHSLIILEAMYASAQFLLYSKASSLCCSLLTVGWCNVTCKPMH